MRDVGFLDVAVAGLQACVVDAAAFVVEPVDRFDFFAVIDEFDLGRAGGVARAGVLPSPAQEVRSAWVAGDRAWLAAGSATMATTTHRARQRATSRLWRGTGQCMLGGSWVKGLSTRAPGEVQRGTGRAAVQGGDLGTVAAQLLAVALAHARGKGLCGFAGLGTAGLVVDDEPAVLGAERKVDDGDLAGGVDQRPFSARAGLGQQPLAARVGQGGLQRFSTASAAASA